jgi:L-threonylcarbamoyladenylate synthase
MSGVIDVATAIELLSKGGVVALPTDTVYGVAASLRDPEAIAKLFALKRRPSSAPLPILVDSIKQVTRLGVVWPEEARMLASAFWPGALTIVVHVPHELALRVSSPFIRARYRKRTDSAGFRIPDDVVVRQIIDTVGPLAVSSANEHGGTPCTTAGQVLEVLGDRSGFEGVVDDGERRSEPSTVVDLSKGGWRLIREGSVGKGVLKSLLG